MKRKNKPKCNKTGCENELDDENPREGYDKKQYCRECFFDLESVSTEKLNNEIAFSSWKIKHAEQGLEKLDKEIASVSRNITSVELELKYSNYFFRKRKEKANIREELRDYTFRYTGLIEEKKTRNNKESIGEQKKLVKWTRILAIATVIVTLVVGGVNTYFNVDSTNKLVEIIESGQFSKFGMYVFFVNPEYDLNIYPSEYDLNSNPSKYEVNVRFLVANTGQIVFHLQQGYMAYLKCSQKEERKLGEIEVDKEDEKYCETGPVFPTELSLYQTRISLSEENIQMIKSNTDCNITIPISAVWDVADFNLSHKITIAK